jgi:surface polysaccharide O-acyltransferase-like enzyme
MASRDAIRAGAVARRPREKRAHPAGPRRPIAARPARRERIAYLDNLKVLLVAAIIAGHSIVGYAPATGVWKGSWPYQDVQEVTLARVSQVILAIPVLPAMMFAMGLFFLISGLVTPGSVARKGPARFARDRLVRLGVPLAIWTLGVWPALLFARDRVEPSYYFNASFSGEVMHRTPPFEPGPMWFVEVLLIYSLGYAAWRGWRTHRASGFATEPRGGADRSHPLGGRTLVALAVGISLATILVRLAFPFDSSQVLKLKLWQWPTYLGLFGLGIIAVQRGGLDPMPDRIRRRCAQTVLLSLAALGLLFAAIAVSGESTNVLHHHLNWAATLFAALEGPLAVGICVWLLSFAQRHLNRPPGARGRALARSAFAAFVIQGPIVFGLQVAVRSLGVPAEVKALTVACVAVTCSFALAWLLVSRTPVGRIL